MDAVQQNAGAPQQNAGAPQQNAGAPNAIERVAVKIPDFWPEKPEVWFAIVESQLQIAGITADATKFHTVLASLEWSVAGQVSDAVTNPPAEGKYENLKQKIIDTFSESEQTKFQKLLSTAELGDRRPTQLLNEMRALANDRVKDDFLKSMWLQRLPAHTRAILQTSSEDLSSLAKMADKIMEVSGEIAEVSTANTDSNGGAVSKRLARIEQFIEELHKERKRSKSRGKSRDKRDNTPGMCWYHKKFGNKARKCHKPCNFEEKPKN